MRACVCVCVCVCMCVCVCVCVCGEWVSSRVFIRNIQMVDDATFRYTCV